MNPPLSARAAPRQPLRCPIKFEASGSTSMFDGTACDVSLGGIFVETESPAAYGAEVVIYMPIDDRKRVVRLPARVRWRRAGGMGLQFGSLGAFETHALLMALGSGTSRR